MAAKKKARKKATARRSTRSAARGRKKAPAELIISKSRTKGAVKKCNISSDFYGALDEYVRNAIAAAEKRALANNRKTLRPQDL